MNDFLFVALSNTIDDLFKDRNCLILWDFFHCVNLVLQRAFLTKLNDHEFEVSVFEAFITLEKVGAVEPHHDFGLFFCQSFSDCLHSDTLFALNVSEVENLDCNEFFCVLIDGFVYLCKGSLSNLLEETILVDFNILKVFLES